MQSVKLFVINSKDRLSYSASTSECEFNFNAMNAKSCEVVSFLMPMTQYNINSTNNRIYFNDGVLRNVTLTTGNYSVYDFIAEIETQLNSVSVGYTVTYSDVSMKLTVTNASLSFQLLFATYSTNSSAYIMGFNTTDTVSALSHTSNSCIDLSLPLFICCEIPEFSRGIETTNGSVSTFIFPNKVNCGDILIYNENTDFKQCTKIFDSDIQHLKVRFKTPRGDILDINGNDWVMVLRICYC